eukprot:scaffold83051_cov57-Phaeocystis_antarctica.AAC.2
MAPKGCCLESIEAAVRRTFLTVTRRRRSAEVVRSCQPRHLLGAPPSTAPPCSRSPCSGVLVGADPDARAREKVRTGRARQGNKVWPARVSSHRRPASTRRLFHASPREHTNIYTPPSTV